MPLPKFLQSSVDPNNVSLTLKGFIPLVLIVTKYFTNTEITQSGLEEIVDVLIVILTGAITLWGLIRKIFPPKPQA